MCETMYKCFFYVLSKGVVGGLGEVMKEPSFQSEESRYFARVFFDLSFFSLVLVVLVNGGTSWVGWGVLSALTMSHPRSSSPFPLGMAYGHVWLHYPPPPCIPSPPIPL